MYLKQKELDKQDDCEKNGVGRKCNITRCYWYKLIIAILLVVLLLNNWTEVEGSVVDQVGCVLGEVEYHKVEIQAHHTFAAIVENHLWVEANRPDCECKPAQDLIHHVPSLCVPSWSVSHLFFVGFLILILNLIHLLLHKSLSSWTAKVPTS